MQTQTEGGTAHKRMETTEHACDRPCKLRRQLRRARSFGGRRSILTLPSGGGILRAAWSPFRWLTFVGKLHRHWEAPTVDDHCQLN